LTNDQAMAIWYTYDTQGNQMWLLGVGDEQSDGSIRFDHMAHTHGPHFGTAYARNALQTADWGTLTLQIDCSSGTVQYVSSDSAFGSGDMPLSRFTSLKEPGCPTVKPKLNDLYDIAWNEIPVSAASSTQPNQIAHIRLPTTARWPQPEVVIRFCGIPTPRPGKIFRRW